MFVPSVHYNSKLFKKLILLAVFFGMCIAQDALAATVGISPNSGTYSSGQSFTVSVQTNPQGDSVNAVEAQLSFDNTKLSVVSVSKTGSVFSLWTTEPTFSNTNGTIDFGGGSPTPFSNTSTLVTITFRVLDEGSANVSVSSASVLAADGLGTDVYSGPSNATFTLSGASTPVVDDTPTPTETPTVEDEEDDGPITFGDPPRAPEAGSTVFLDPEIWYDTKVGVFTWDIPFDVDEIALDISTSSEFTPVTTYNPPIEQISLNADLLDDGEQYLTLQFKNQVGWGGILHRKIRVDTVPPERFTINVRAGNSSTAFPLLTFEANDSISGIDMYELSIAGGEPIEITPDQADVGYLLTDLEDGTYTVTVTAYDKAGNATESTTAVLITAGWTPPVEIVIETSVWDFFKGKNLIILILIAIIISQTVWRIQTKKKIEQKEQKMRKETKEIQDQMEKIFSALRDEIFDQINMITKRERLSKKEKEAVENLHQALEVSETLIEKEITDVSKILK